MLIDNVERIGKVLEPDEYLILVHREQSVSALPLEPLAQLLRERKQLLVRLLANLLLQAPLIVKSEEVLRWLLNHQLLLPLE